MTVVGARKSMSAVHSDSRSSPRTRGENSSHWLAHLADPKVARSYTVSKSGSAPHSAMAVGMAFVGLVVMRKPSPLHGRYGSPGGRGCGADDETRPPAGYGVSRSGRCRL